MLESGKLDVLCLQLWNKLPELDNPLKKDVKKLLDTTKKSLATNSRISNEKILEQIFELRFKAVKWFLDAGDFDFALMFDKIYPEFEEYKTHPKFSILAENILFALRSNKRVMESFINSEAISEETLRDSFEHTSSLTLNQFIASLSMSIPDENFIQNMLDWAKASLEIEFVVFAAMLIFKKSIVVSRKKINDLSLLAANAAQTYIACSMDLRYLKQSNQCPSSGSKLSSSFIKEQTEFSELGFSDYAERLSNE